MTALRFAPVTAESRADFEALFESPGAPKYCWCMAWRDMLNRQSATNEDRKQAMISRVTAGTPVGLLAYADGAPIAWCSVAPRETYRKLSPTRTRARPAYGPSPASTSAGNTASSASQPHSSTRQSSTPSRRAPGRSRPIRSIQSRRAIASWAFAACSPHAASARPARPARAVMWCGWRKADGFGIVRSSNLIPVRCRAHSDRKSPE